MNSNGLLHFVGHKGELIHYIKNTTQSKSADVFRRSWVVYQWLSGKHVINPNYQNLLLPSLFEFINLLNSQTKSFLSENIKTFDD